MVKNQEIEREEIKRIFAQLGIGALMTAVLIVACCIGGWLCNLSNTLF